MIQGTLTWNDAGNNQAYAAGQIGMTFNGVSIYYVLKNSPDPTLRRWRPTRTIKIRRRFVTAEAAIGRAA